MLVHAELQWSEFFTNLMFKFGLRSGPMLLVIGTLLDTVVHITPLKVAHYGLSVANNRCRNGMATFGTDALTCAPRWSTPRMDTHIREAVSPLPAFWVRTGYLMAGGLKEREWGDGGERIIRTLTHWTKPNNCYFTAVTVLGPIRGRVTDAEGGHNGPARRFSRPQTNAQRSDVRTRPRHRPTYRNSETVQSGPIVYLIRRTCVTIPRAAAR
ncbi:hypothetical protein EVAR_27803_1 [Eumeta japonica]|uniref:Uncharacterized protein n=1 Tax=Eumeta variegata TaxID=151549 RepID=A0A4C1VJZ2_EUMVA|nr:hypothetical protein EVAR_27803_1 [Eumeta japonica]